MFSWFRHARIGLEAVSSYHRSRKQGHAIETDLIMMPGKSSVSYRTDMFSF
jgi:hypothetical protein